jgi:hypothetical protein
MMRRQVKLNDPAPFGLLYAALIGGWVLLFGGFFLCWMAGATGPRWPVMYGPTRPSVPMSVICPELYYFAEAALAIGAAICLFIFVLCAFRWVRGVRFSLAELIVSMLLAGLGLCFVINNCQSGMFAHSSMASWMISPVLWLFFDLSDYRNCAEGINIAVYVCTVLASLFFVIPLCSRLPERHRIARYLFCAISVAAATGIGGIGLTQLLGVFSVAAILLYGVSNRSALAALFSPKKAPTLVANQSGVRMKPTGAAEHAGVKTADAFSKVEANG